MSVKLSDLRIRGFKLKEQVSIFTGPAPTGGLPPSRGLTFVSIEHDKTVWNGWEFVLIDGGLLITPPWKGDFAFVPFSNVAFMQLRPQDVAKAAK